MRYPLHSSLLLLLLLLLAALSFVAGVRHDTSMREPLTLLNVLAVIGALVAALVVADRRP